MERFRLFKPVLSLTFPDRMRKLADTAALYPGVGKTITRRAQDLLQHIATTVRHTTTDITLALMRSGLHIATDLQRFFLTDVSLYNCLQYAASLTRQAASLLKK